MPPKINLKGHRFGRLTVLEQAENLDRKTAWCCRCDCGKLIVVKTYNLRRDAVRSCGCIIPPRGNVGNLSYVDGTCLEMIRANTVRKNNTSGCPGVYWDKRNHGWRAQIGFKGTHYTLGHFPPEEKDRAIAARKEAERRFFGQLLSHYAQEE